MDENAGMYYWIAVFVKGGKKFKVKGLFYHHTTKEAEAECFDLIHEEMWLFYHGVPRGAIVEKGLIVEHKH